MAKKKHHRPAQKPQKKRKKAQHLPKVGSPDQHRWDDNARDDVVGYAMWWVLAAIVIIAVAFFILYFMNN